MGAEVKRKEDPRMITGTSTYVTDVVLPGMQWVAFVRSPHAHARIRRIDTQAGAAGARRVAWSSPGEEIRKLAKALPARERVGRGRRQQRRARSPALAALDRPASATSARRWRR